MSILRAVLSLWEDLTLTRALDNTLTPAQRAAARMAHYRATLAAARGTTPMAEARRADDADAARALRDMGYDGD